MRGLMGFALNKRSVLSDHCPRRQNRLSGQEQADDCGQEACHRGATQG